MYKVTQSRESFSSWLEKLPKKALANVTIPLLGDNLPGLLSDLTSSAINKKINGKGTVRAGKGFTLFISNEDVTDIIKIKKNTRRLRVINWWSYWHSKKMK